MKRRRTTIEIAAADATKRLGIHISASDIGTMVELGLLPALESEDGSLPVVRLADSRRLAAQVHMNVHVGGLFDNIPELFQRLSHNRASARKGISSAAARYRGGVVFLGLSQTIGLAFTLEKIPTEVIQLFISLIRAASIQPEGPPLVDTGPTPIDIDSDITVWSTGKLPLDLLRDLWMKAIRKEAVTSYTESLATAKIYGNKARLTAFLVGVAGLYLAEGGTICDLMAGTGIVSLRMAEIFDVYANDANPFAAHLTKCRAATISHQEAEDTLQALQGEFEKNAAYLQSMLHELLETEAAFLHGVATTESLVRYQGFCRSFPQQLPAESTLENTDGDAAVVSMSATLLGMIHERRQNPRAFPYCLATSYYANAYLGLSQAIAVDSIRYAVDKCVQGTPRELSLGALILAVSSCGSGPHFAQPPKLSSTKAMKEIIEHRARDLFLEFSMLFRLLATHSPSARSIKAVWCNNWRDALISYESLTSTEERCARAVYIDAPYTKLQYSRYYHVFNTLLSYHYPLCVGVGRYPPRSDRFSSKFEFQPASATREFADVFDMCSASGMVTLVSYSNRGLVPLRILVSLMEVRFRVVELFTKPVRHHSQGKPLSATAKSVVEYVLVGLP